MHSAVEIIKLRPRHVFRISRGDKAEVRNVIFRLESGGITGIGEASPNAFYGETAEDVAARLQALEVTPCQSAEEIVAFWPELWRRVAPSRAAACAVDLALWDWLGQAQGKSLCELLWGEKARPVTSCVTLGISEPGELPEKLAEIADFPLIKIKAAATGIVELVREIRRQTSARLVVDANASWTAESLAIFAPPLAALGVEMIEQPLPPGEGFVAPKEIPIFADESCVVPEDIERLPASFAGFNLKLVKCGGITPALEMLERGKRRGLRSMIGCMLESSVLIAAGAALAQRTDYADLDGSWLLQSEPFGRVQFARGLLKPLSS